MRYAPEELICTPDKVTANVVEPRATALLCAQPCSRSGGSSGKHGCANLDVREKGVLAAPTAGRVQSPESGWLLWKAIPIQKQQQEGEQKRDCGGHWAHGYEEDLAAGLCVNEGGLIVPA